MIDERRNVPRYELGLQIQVGDVVGVTSNISLEGVMFVSPARFTLGETVDVTLFVPADKGRTVMRLEGSGIVRRVDQNSRGEFETAVELDGLRVLTDVKPLDVSERPRSQISGR